MSGYNTCPMKLALSSSKQQILKSIIGVEFVERSTFKLSFPFPYEFGGPDLVSKYVDTKDQTESLDVLASIIHSAAHDPQTLPEPTQPGK
jgi:hypothetical protein